MARTAFSHIVQDDYTTPLYAVRLITPYLSKFSKIWCPFDTEDSNYVKELKRMGKDVIATHISNGQDFLTTSPDFEYDAIISNPPFSIKNDILERCYELGKPFALLLPFTMFNSVRTINILSKNNSDVQFLITDRRISFDGNRPNFTCWYVCRGVLPNQINTFIFDENPNDLFRKEREL